MDKLVLGLIGDILYHKGVINADEYDGLLDMRTHLDIDAYMDKMYRGEFNAFKRGEHYTAYGE